MAAAVTPANRATPYSTGHTARTRTLDGTVTSPAYGHPPVDNLKVLLSRFAQGAALELADLELLERDLLDHVHVAQHVAELVAERGAPCDQIGSRFEQVLVGNHLAGCREQQRRHRFGAANPVLRDVLVSDAQRFFGEVLLADLRRRIPQHVG